MLFLLLTLPLAGLFLFLIPDYQYDSHISEENFAKVRYTIKKQGKVITLIIMSLTLLVSLGIFGLFNFSATQFQFVQEHYNISSFDIYLGVDGISIYFIVRPLINTKPVPLRTVIGLLLHKPTNLSEVEMTRGVKHVSKSLIEVKYIPLIKAEVIFIQALITQLYSQYYIMTSKILVTKCNNKYVEIWNTYFSSLLLIGILSLINLSAKDRISDFVLRIGDLLTPVLGINIKRLLILVLIYILPKGDGVTVIPFIKKFREGSQEFVLNTIRTGINGLRLNNKIRTPFKPINLQVRLYTSKIVKNLEYVAYADKQQQEILNINPWFFTGFVDGEGCFLISLYEDNRISTGWRVQLWFKIGLHIKDKDILKKIRNYLKIGRISGKGLEIFEFYAFSIEDLLIIINHFDKYPLLTQKQIDFNLFKLAFNSVKNKEHLTSEGLQKLVSIKASMNKENLSDKLKSAFPNITPVTRQLVFNKNIDPNWVAGFVSGEGCFMVKILKSSSNHIGFQIILVFQITQHIRDNLLINSLIEFFGCGKVYKRNNAVDFRVTKITDVTDIIIPFLNLYKIIGIKNQDYLDWCTVAELVKNKEHLTYEGLNKIKIIKDKMNTKRVWGDNIPTSKDIDL